MYRQLMRAQRRETPSGPPPDGRARPGHRVTGAA
jgi:hypothetical protein